MDKQQLKLVYCFTKIKMWKKHIIHDVKKSLNSDRLHFGRKTLCNVRFCWTKEIYVLMVIVEPSRSFKN